ncbi:type ISP restriction/modification enzyme [Rhizobium sp. TRM95796]|uniref:type ISP restriction/modification enzyme n=1 Tax=Rhizobium sp. TRM95796 TaxID=2979862 RepID=UPI0021E74B49|nr:type ISP restriction/modification enzyme [Rhizobium sp. TRM95796]MCV3765086.1 N-6 DNA methylase [Rhizobium sp. TRM95796]
MSQQLINQYLNEIDRLRKFSGSVTEGVISEAFKDLLKTWARQLNWQFAAQYEFASNQKSRIRPDGTIFHSIGLPFGYWEAKDTADDLDVEIRKKLAKGYPQDNIIFENSHTAVLIQDRAEVLRCAMTDNGALLKLLTLFFGYERAEIREFRKAVEEFKTYLPHVLGALRSRIETAYADNAPFKAAAQKFLETCKETINPTLTEADVREMLIQHILTEEIFANVFNEGDFHHENNIARELYALEGKFFTGAVKKETLKGLEPYYAAIRANAAQITSHSEKQTFLKVIYENFYKVYDTKKADRLGVVYTPNEIVKFMIEGADWLCEKHFGKNLIDPHVEILDPATGTGTFICELLDYFRGDPKKLAHKYKNELHANEVAILPYYVANLNIEATYAAISGQFAEFPNLCFVDTLDNVEGLGIRAGHQHDMFAALSDENIERVKRQNARKISVIIGNPPYNANQQNENDNNKNRAYPRIDELIKSSYIRLSTAQKTKVYDMYARFFRWASDRMHDDGVLAFVTNRSFIDSRTFDGFRKAVAEEFHEIHVVDLGGDVRANPKLSGTKHNVFGIQTGVAISFLGKRRKQKGCKIFYVRRPEFDTASEKLSFLGASKLATLKCERIEPDKKGNWINQTDNDWESLIPVADKKTKTAKTSSQERAIFRLFSLGIVTNRDEWAYGETEDTLLNKVSHFVGVYQRDTDFWHQLRRSERSNFSINREIKWTSELERHLQRRTPIKLSKNAIYKSNYRPFVHRFTYFSPVFTHRPYQNFEFFPFQNSKNLGISVSVEDRVPFAALATNAVPNKDLFLPNAAQFLPLYRYTATGERIDNITDWGLKQFHKAYGRDGLRSVDPQEMSAEPTAAVPQCKASAGNRALGKQDVFHYVYAVLHDPIYRETYAQNLKRDFPRIPFYPDFWAWAGWGEKLMALHIGYETVEPFAVTRIDTPDAGARAAGLAPKPILKADPAAGVIRIDSETTLSGIPSQAFAYRLGNRSGLEWILDQYKEKTPKDPTIREKFNTYRFADYKEKVIDLIARVTEVSIQTMEITDAMKKARRAKTAASME